MYRWRSKRLPRTRCFARIDAYKHYYGKLKNQEGCDRSRHLNSVVCKLRGHLEMGHLRSFTASCKHILQLFGT